MENKVCGNYHSFLPSSPPLLPFQVDEGGLAPPRFFANVQWRVLAVPGTTFDSDLRPECDDKRPRLIMDEAELCWGEARGPAIRPAAAAITQPVRESASPSPGGWGGEEPTVENPKPGRPGELRGAGVPAGASDHAGLGG